MGEDWVVTWDGDEWELQPGLNGLQSISRTQVEKSLLKDAWIPKKLRKNSNFLIIDVSNKSQQDICRVPGQQETWLQTSEEL